MNINVQVILKTTGSMLLMEALMMLLATVIALLDGCAGFVPLLLSSVVMAAAGGALRLSGQRANERHAGRREGMLTVTLTWILLSFFGMMPYYIGGYIPSITDAYFETMSGFTTTGATILLDVESLPSSILLWRSLTQWQGGIGIIVFTVALMPVFGNAATLIYEAESTGTGITHDHFLPRVTQVAKRLAGIYLLLTVLLTLLLYLGPMSFFDAVNHALTTVSSGGYSTRNAGISFYGSSYIEYLLIIFMSLSATNISLLYFAIKGDHLKWCRDDELRWYYMLIVIVTLITFTYLCYMRYPSSLEGTFRVSLFQVVSLLTTTGFLTSDYGLWGSFFTIIVIFLTVVCGCAGSTCGGLKMGRFVILVKNMLNDFKKQTHPSAVIPLRISGHAMSSQMVQRVQTFAFVYMGLIFAGSVIFLLHGLDFEESLGTSISAISNIGPSLGNYIEGNFSVLPSSAKWLYSFLMLVGRLEIFTVLTLLLPGFWRN